MAPGYKTQGRRVPDGELHLWEAVPSQYGRVKIDDAWHWRVVTPNGLAGNLDAHEVVEHDDGAITVSPSILVSAPGRSHDQSWHGFLEHGTWREV